MGFMVLLFMVICLENLDIGILSLSISQSLSLLQLYYYSILHLWATSSDGPLYDFHPPQKTEQNLRQSKIPYVSLCYNKKRKRNKIFSTLYCKTVMLLIDLIFDP